MSRKFQLPYGKRIQVYRSGDPNFKATQFNYNPLRYKRLDKFLNEVAEKVPFWGAVRSIHTPNTGTLVTNLDTFERDGKYVAAGPKGFVSIPGGYENIGKSPLPARKLQGYKRIKRGGMKQEEKTVWIFRNGDTDTHAKPFKIIPAAFQNWENTLYRISEAIRLPSSQVKRLFDLNGRVIDSVESFEDNGYYVATSFNEAYRPLSYRKGNHGRRASSIQTLDDASQIGENSFDLKFRPSPNVNRKKVRKKTIGTDRDENEITGEEEGREEKREEDEEEQEKDENREEYDEEQEDAEEEDNEYDSFSHVNKTRTKKSFKRRSSSDPERETSTTQVREALSRISLGYGSHAPEISSSQPSLRSRSRTMAMPLSAGFGSRTMINSQPTTINNPHRISFSAPAGSSLHTPSKSLPAVSSIGYSAQASSRSRTTQSPQSSKLPTLLPSPPASSSSLTMVQSPPASASSLMVAQSPQTSARSRTIAVSPPASSSSQSLVQSQLASSSSPTLVKSPPTSARSRTMAISPPASSSSRTMIQSPLTSPKSPTLDNSRPSGTATSSRSLQLTRSSKSPPLMASSRSQISLQRRNSTNSIISEIVEPEEEIAPDTEWKSEGHIEPIYDDERPPSFDSGHSSLFLLDGSRPGSVFNAKQKSRPSTTMEVDYDTDESGIFRARSRNEYTKNAFTVLEDKRTKIEVPIDYMEAKEVMEEVY